MSVIGFSEFQFIFLIFIFIFCFFILFFFFFFKQKTAYEIGLGIPAEPLFRSVKDCVTIDVLPRTPGNNVYVGFMVWSNFTATKCRGLVSLNQVIKEIICLQPLK